MALRFTKMLAVSVASLAITAGAWAQTTTTTDVPGHPRVNEIDQRLSNQQNRTDAGAASGTINARQEARDQARDARVSQELSADEAAHNGHITRAEQRHMNRQLNRNSHAIQRQDAAPGSATAPAAH